jgi:primosomal protein N' (replication factor Y)
MTSILRVALPVPLHTLFDYREGAARAAVGSRVRVPFGRRERVGIVAERVDASTLDEARLKVAGEVLDEAPLLGGELLATLRWAARYYQHPLGEVLFAALPTSLRNARALPPGGIAAAELTPAGAAALAAATPRRGTRIASLLEALVAGPLATTRLDALAGAAARRNALARGWIARCRLATPAQAAAASAGPPLNDAQREAAQAVIGAGGGFAPFLLDGVTGSGKTEVYLEIIRDCLARGRQALVLVPEIALTPQALRRFRERLGVDVAALHSGLGEVERARAWLAAARGEAPLVLGTRSAVLVPLARPGVIIVDEEHDGSYKQQEGFRYHARDLALVRAKALGIPVVLGSATPSLESLANVEAKRYRLLRLDQRAGRARPPTLQVVDLRRQRLQHGLARPALEAIAACLARDEQVLVFRNRRGYAPVLLCHDCGWSARCPDCERALTLHKREGRLRCHHCGHEERVPAACPSCSGLALHALGEGTERLEDALGAQFPGVPVVRVDRDTTRGRRLRDALLDSLPEGGARILVGTQMLAKGHDLPHLTLVVVVGVDEGLYSVDFRAGERLGQLVVQVAGRAGRADRPGTVLVQTYLPENPVIAALAAQDRERFLAVEAEARRRHGMPPYGRLAALVISSPDADEADFIAAAFARAAPQMPGISVLGPAPAPLALLRGRHRRRLLLKARRDIRVQPALRDWLGRVKVPGTARVQVDVDPYSFL